MPRAIGGKYAKADACVVGAPPFTYIIGVQCIPASVGYPECFGVRGSDGLVVAWLTESQVREALEKFDAIAVDGM